MTTKKLPKEIKEKLNSLAIVSNENRFNILLALFNSSVLKLGKHSHTFTELREVVGLTNPDLSYHLNLLKEIKLINKKDHSEGDGRTTYYDISDKGKEILSKNLGITPKTIKDIKKKILA